MAFAQLVVIHPCLALPHFTCTPSIPLASFYSSSSFFIVVPDLIDIATIRYFSHSSQVSININSFSTEEVGALDPCKHCDNCIRSPESIERRDVTLATWQILQVVNAVQRAGGRLTLSMLATLARGGNKGAFEASQARRSAATKQTLDIQDVAGGRVDLSKNVCAFMCCRGLRC